MVGHDFTIPDTSAAIQVCREAAASVYDVGKAFEEGARIYVAALNAMQDSMSQSNCSELERLGITVKERPRKRKPKQTPLQQKMLRQKWDASRRGSR